MGAHTPPGAPDWRLPSPATPMIWEGLTDRQLCELLKDPKQNGDRTVAQIVESVYANTDRKLWSVAAEQVRAHLDALEADGRIEQSAGSYRVR